MFSNRVRVGALAVKSAGVNNLTVEGYLRDVLHIFAYVGGKDLHLDVLVKIKFCLSQKLCAYA